MRAGRANTCTRTVERRNKGIRSLHVRTEHFKGAGLRWNISCGSHHRGHRARSKAGAGTAHSNTELLQHLAMQRFRSLALTGCHCAGHIPKNAACRSFPCPSALQHHWLELHAVTCADVGSVEVCFFGAGVGSSRRTSYPSCPSNGLRPLAGCDGKVKGSRSCQQTCGGPAEGVRSSPGQVGPGTVHPQRHKYQHGSKTPSHLGHQVSFAASLTSSL